MKKILLLTLCLAMLTGCASPAGVSAMAADQPAGPELSAGDEACAAFSAELLRRCREEGTNTLISPLSVILALGMTANGASGETLKEMETVFGMDLAALNAWCARAMETYTGLGGSTEANLVNSLWCDDVMEINGSFAECCRRNYSAELRTLDLQAADAADTVNAWVNEATRGMIPRVLDSFPPEIVLALVNAVYLKNAFETPFETPASDWKMDFTAEDGTVSRPSGMSNGTRTELYLAGENGQGVLLPYDDGRLGLLLMLPFEGTSLTDYLASWGPDTIRELLAARTERLVDLQVPRFRITWSDSLRDILSAMGMAGAFAQEADFSLLGRVNGAPLYLGDVLHKTVLQVNEKGTEAAAVTTVMVAMGMALPPENMIRLIFDRPFICGIVDMETGVPLFLGTVENLAE